MMSEEQRARYLPRMAKGEFLGAFAMSEPDAGSDLASISCRARKDGDGLPDQRQQVLVHVRRRRRLPIIFARTSDAPPGKRHLGLSMFLVEKKRGSCPRACNGAPIPKIGYFGWKTWELAFDDFRVGPPTLIGEEGQAFYYATSGPGDGARPHRGPRHRPGPGRARGRHRYAKERRQFGQPIADFQAIRFKIADMATEIEAARQLIYFVCEQIDTGERCDKEASMVKLFASEMAERVTSEGCRSTAAPATPRSMPSSATGATRG